MSKDIRVIREDCCNIWNNLKNKTQMIDYLIESKQQIADLEAKLAESESVRKGAIEEIKKLHKRINEIVDRDKNIVENLNRQLEDKDKEITQRLVIQE